MSARAKTQYDYMAHIQGDDGHVIEVAGRRLAWSSREVYNYLMKRAADSNGWLVANHIAEVDDDVPFEPDVLMLPAPAEQAGKVDEEVGKVFGAEEHFGKWKSSYKPASLCTYKETG